MYKEEFVKFCADLRYYVCQPLTFYKHPDRECPCAYIGEGEQRISIFFVHYKTEEDAEKKWVERCKRIQWDNIYIIACDGDNLGNDEMEIFEKIQCKRKIMLISREEKSRDGFTFVLYSLKNEKTATAHQIRVYRYSGLRTWEFEFDYVAWLNGEKEFRKKISRHHKKVLGIE